MAYASITAPPDTSASSPTATAAYLEAISPHSHPPTPSKVALVQALGTARESLVQRAADGNGLAIAKLAQDHQHPAHAPGPVEPGKGQLIDEYD